MTSARKIAIAAAVVILVGTVVAALTLKPAADIWTRAEQLRQIIALGLATVVVALVAASVESEAPAASPPSTTPTSSTSTD